MVRINPTSRLKLIEARKVKSSQVPNFSRRVRTFFEQNKLGAVEASYFRECLKQFGNEETAFKKLRLFLKKSAQERKEIVEDRLELMQSMSFRFGE